MQVKKKGLILSAIFTIFFIVVLFIGFFIYNKYISNKLYNTADQTLQEIVNQQTYVFNSKIEAEMLAIKILAESLVTSNDLADITITKLERLQSKSEYDHLVVIDKNGNAVNEKGEKVNLSHREYFQKALLGETNISTPLESVFVDDTMIAIATPLIYQNEIIGVFVVSFIREQFSGLFDASFGKKGFAYIIDNTGEIITKTKNKNSVTITNNLFDLYEKVNFYEGDSFAKIKKNIKLGVSGRSKYTVNGENRILRYGPISVNGWNIFSVVPANNIMANVHEITLATLAVSFCCFILFLILLFWVLFIQRKNIKRLEKIAFVDPLTQAPTLAYFKIEAQKFIDQNPNKMLLMVKFDIDCFKLINQTFGSEVGDKVLKSISLALADNTSGNIKHYARTHDDEFFVLHEYNSDEELLQIHDNFKTLFDEYLGSDFNYGIRFVFGHYCMELESCKNAIDAMEKANIAHRRAKRKGMEICVYDESFIIQSIHQKEIENKMKSALLNDEFKVYFQPKYNLLEESIIGAEALVRWKPVDEQMIYPNDFIPIFEKNGFITELDMYMFDSVCKTLRLWINKHLPLTRVSVNFSRNHLKNNLFVETLIAICDKHQVPHHLLEIELTESVIFNNVTILTDVLTKLHAAGFILSMDDFGTGYSSLGLLKNLPVDVIKIDRSFFTTANNEVRAKTVIASIIKMAHDLSVETVAEGVETKEHIDLLKELGCDVVQGYYYARPMPLDAFATLFHSK